MKKVIILMTAAVLCLSTSSFAATPNDAVNEKALSAFAHDFSSATQVKWEDRGSFYLVGFKVGNTRFNAAYNEEGELIASSKSLGLNELPATVTTAVKKKYVGYEIGNNASALISEGKTSYYLTISNSTQILHLKVDAAGRIKVEQKVKL